MAKGAALSRVCWCRQGGLLDWRVHAGTPARAVLSIVGLLAWLRALRFAWTQHVVLPFYDLWYWIPDLQRWFDGHYRLADLAKPWVEHRIVTTRLLLIPDAVWFGMQGWLPSAVGLVLFGALGLMLWRLSRLPALPPLFWVAWFTATSQGDNLVLPFQVQFPLVFAFAVAAICLLDAAAEARAGAMRLSLAAGLSGVVAVFSMGNGVLVAPAVLPMLWLRRARMAAWLPWAVLTAAATLAFFWGHPSLSGGPGPIALLARLAYLCTLLGGSFGCVPSLSLPLGAATLAAFAFWLLLTLWRRSATGADPALVAVGSFACLSAIAPSITSRALGGADAALVSRYATISLLFLAPLLVVAMPVALRLRASAQTWACLVAAGSLVAVNISNSVWYAGPLRQFAEMLANNVVTEGPTLLDFYPKDVDHLRPQLAFLHARHLNLFAPAMRLPRRWAAAVSAADPAKVPACRGYVDTIAALDDHAVLTSGWVAAPNGKRGVAWLVAREGDEVVGAVPPSVSRPDVVLPNGAPAGFETGFRLRKAADPLAPAREFRLFGVRPGASAPICVLTQPASVGPLAVLPLGKLRSATPMIAANTLLFRTDTDTVCWGCGRYVTKLPREIAAYVFTVPAVPAGSGLALPFWVENGGMGGRIAFRLGDGVEYAVDVPPQWGRPDWRAAVLPSALLARHPGPITLEVRVPPGQNLRPAPPLRVETDPDWSRLF